MSPTNRSVADCVPELPKPGIPETKQPSPGFLHSTKGIIDYYTEPDPTVGEWLRGLVPTPQGALRYVRSIFRFTQWLPHYNLTWLLGDSIAGLTVGFVVIPQAMAYALLALLSPEYGLYTSFVGAAIYWIFGTSKDIVVGTTAIGSLLAGSVISSVQEQRPGTYTNEEIAKTLSMVAGMILLAIGLLRLGWIIEFIPYISISAFVTAASVTIMATQFPTLMGITGVNTHEAPYVAIIDSLRGLPRTRVDAAIGLSSIVLLYAARYFCARMQVRYPAKQKTWAIISSLRLTFTLLLCTFISWLVNRKRTGPSPFRIVGRIEKGFIRAGTPSWDKELVKLVLPELPAILIILVIEHVAIAKSFGRAFDYTVVPSQEILAQGASNLLGTFVGGYVCTGSFGASAVLSKAGVRTPLAGLFSAMILVMALYVLTSVFYYIPMAALAGSIIHAVADLPTPPRTLYKYWKLSPLEFFIWWIGVLIAIFVSLEISIYLTTCISLALLLIRTSRSRGHFLGQVRVHHYHAPGRRTSSPRDSDTDLPSGSTTPGRDPSPGPLPEYPSITNTKHSSSRNIFLPLDHHDGSNPDVAVSVPYPGVFIYRFPAGLNYTNQAQHVRRLVRYIKAHTRPGSGTPPYPSSSSSTTSSKKKTTIRSWSDATSPTTPPAQTKPTSSSSSPLPPLRAIVLDCTAIDTIDITSAQGLVDAQRSLDRHAAGSTTVAAAATSTTSTTSSDNNSSRRVQWHFAGLANPWARRALAAAGFGGGGGCGLCSGTTSPRGSGRSGAAAVAAAEEEEDEKKVEEGVGSGRAKKDEEWGAGAGVGGQEGPEQEEWERGRVYLVAGATGGRGGEDGGAEEKEAEEGRAKGPPLRPVYGVDRPCFHVDLLEAVEAAVRGARRVEELEGGVEGCGKKDGSR
ncbi:hypothetical protein VTK26DRAFT_876 [Humicola hyalothermophila]